MSTFEEVSNKVEELEKRLNVIEVFLKHSYLLLGNGKIAGLRRFRNSQKGE